LVAALQFGYGSAAFSERIRFSTNPLQ